MDRLKCFFLSHAWSPWTRYIRGDVDYRFCYRCGKSEVFRRVNGNSNR